MNNEDIYGSVYDVILTVSDPYSRSGNRCSWMEKNGRCRRITNDIKKKSLEHSLWFTPVLEKRDGTSATRLRKMRENEDYQIGLFPLSAEKKNGCRCWRNVTSFIQF